MLKYTTSMIGPFCNLDYISSFLVVSSCLYLFLFVMSGNGLVSFRLNENWHRLFPLSLPQSPIGWMQWSVKPGFKNCILLSKQYGLVQLIFFFATFFRVIESFIQLQTTQNPNSRKEHNIFCRIEKIQRLSWTMGEVSLNPISTI